MLKLITHYGLSGGGRRRDASVGVAIGGRRSRDELVHRHDRRFSGLLQWISDGNARSSRLRRLASRRSRGRGLGHRVAVFYALGATIVLWLLLEFTVVGRQGDGANRAAATLSGIHTVRARTTAFTIAGLLASVGGILITARVGGADATSGPGFLLPAYAAAFLGATAIRPGFFNVWGTLIATFLVAVGITGLQLKGAESWVTPVFNGGILLIAVAVSNVAGTRRLLWRGRPGDRGGRGGRNE